MRKSIWTLAAGLCLTASPAMAQSAEVAAAVSADARSEQAKAQDEARRPATVLEFADIEKGDVVADILAGNGYFSEMIASIVGSDGKVYIVNPTGFHDPQVWAAHQEKRDNYRLLVGDPKSLVLGPDSVDMIFTHMVFHDLFWQSEQFNFPRLDVPWVLANWHAALKDGGTVIIVDHDGPEGDPREVVERLHRLDRDAAVATMEQAGFRLVEENDALINLDDDLEVLVFDEAVRGKTSRYMLKFTK
ncbi:methyltransferase [Altererythrobacter sp. MF3-039]|uniref:methyltransferase n=1 Tax=Altererythrobacter sp. MF3-039 TaxID=3252901 RepID=UPI00390CD6FE